MFSIDIKRLYWVQDKGDDPSDFCLHGEVIVNIGDELFEDSCTVSATALFLLKTLTEDHITNENNQMLPCCGYFYIPNDALDSVQICGCPNGVDWTVILRGETVVITTESGNEVKLSLAEYARIVFNFADIIMDFYVHALPKKILSDDFDRKGYVAFWNEWARRRNVGELSDSFFCPATSRVVDNGLCWEYFFAGRGGPKDTAKQLKEWISETGIFKNLKDFHVICEFCCHKQSE